MGEHCTEPSCKLLDYLPMKCDACEKIFCKDHLLYDDHRCDSLHKKNIQVPVCPLCSNPVPVTRGTLPDIAISQHIDQACQIKKKDKVFTNRCNKPKCKKKELIKVTCNICNLNFCLTHRHPNDHECKGPSAGGARAGPGSTSRPSNAAGAAAAARAAAGQSTQSKITNFFSGPFRPEGRPTPTAGRPSAAPTRPPASGRHIGAAAMPQGMSEDEALAAALAASMADVPAPPTSQAALSQEDEDRLLAQALQESERSAGRGVPQTTASSSSDKQCTIS